MAGRTFVLEGPPGTGKSQTITNLLTRAVADGKRVLFVAEKRAALDVVSRRLDAVGMGMFALDLHDKGSRASTVRAQIRLALEHAVAVDAQGLATEEERLRSSRRMLARYADRLHAENATGLSLYSARTAELAAGTDVPALPVPQPFVANAPAEVLTAVRRALALLPEIADLTRPSLRHPWAFVDSPRIDLRETQQAAAAVDAAAREVAAVPELSGVLRRARTVEELDALAHVLAGPGTGLDVIDETFTELWTAKASAVLGEIAAFTAFRHPGLDVCTPEVLALPAGRDLRAGADRGGVGLVRPAPAAERGARPARRSPPPRRRRSSPRTCPRWSTACGGCRTRSGRSPAGPPRSPGSRRPRAGTRSSQPGVLDDQVALAAPGRRGGRRLDAFHVELRRLIVAGMPAEPGARHAVEPAAGSLATMLAVCRSSTDQLATWAGDDGFLLRWSMTRPERGVENSVQVSLRRWVSFLDNLEPLRFAGLFDARTQLVTGAMPADDAVRAFDRGLAVASVAERLDATGLDTVRRRRRTRRRSAGSPPRRGRCAST